jgi:glycosyltransferase involved in cell wall biosynthesis
MLRSVPALDLVLPTYNEAPLLASTVHRVLAAMRASGRPSWRILIADNGSTDGTDRIAQELAAEHSEVRLLRLDEKGRGRALRRCWEETDAELSLYMDADLSTDLAAIAPAVAQLEAGADIVTGSRLSSRSQTARCFHREALSRGYDLLVRSLLRPRSFHDAQCGFKGVRVARIRPLLPWVEDQRWFFDTELLWLAERRGLRIATLPVHWVERRDSRVEMSSCIWECLQGLARLRLRPAARTARSAAQPSWP